MDQQFRGRVGDGGGAFGAPPPPPEAVLRRKGGWSGYGGVDADARPRPSSAAAANTRKPVGGKPEQYAASKPGFVGGRNVWTGTAERRARHASAPTPRHPAALTPPHPTLAGAAAAIAAARSATNLS